MEQKVTSPVLKGVIITLLLIVFGLIIYFTGQMANKSISYLQYAILCIGIIWSCTSYAKQLNGNVTFGNVFGHGLKTTAVVAALLAVYTFIAVKFLVPIAIGTILFMFAIVGAISSLIGAAVAKKNPQGPFVQQQM